MTTLLVLRERMKKVYARYGGHIIKILRFLLMLTVFMVINESVGYMERLNHVWLAAALAFVCAFLPWGVSAALAPSACIIFSGRGTV